MGALFSSAPPELPDLTGSVAIVTGGNAGIGYYTVQRLAKHGAKVYMGARNEERARAAIEKLHAEGLGDKAGESRGTVIFLDLDLTHPSKAKAAAEYIVSREQRLDILVNNAGMYFAPCFLTFAITDRQFRSHLSPFIFTNTLLPLMKATAKLPDSDVRIVNVLSSVMHGWVSGNIAFDSLEAINVDFGPSGNGKSKLYAYTKLLNVLHTKELQKRLDTDNVPIIVTAVHPGYVWTGTNRLHAAAPSASTDMPCRRRLWLAILHAVTVPAERGADTSLFAAASPQVRASPEKYKGAYLVPMGQIKHPSGPAMDPKNAADLWEASEKQLAAIGL
ncbi:NAD-P-binding protein [Athelia psychrophila]|uniref:NAD-P-binding protein n=1 Tax=Athelia psychrophila TaxID=1759441 RepID=A0A166GSS6_9AGAM|nr:NAD-P-binding protein [Fibularhizoctonia sp. CBS 109695]